MLDAGFTQFAQCPLHHLAAIFSAAIHLSSNFGKGAPLVASILVLLVAPTTPQNRMQRIAESSRGFTYLVSVTGVTGERVKLQDRVATLVSDLKACNSGPVAVGFGISGPEQVLQVKQWGVLGMLGCIDALLTSVVADSLTRTEHNSNKELIGQGLGNLVSGLFGGLPGAGATMGTVVNIQAGGRSALSGIVRAILAKAGVELITGWGRFLDPHRIGVSRAREGEIDQVLQAKRVMISVGGRPFRPNVPGAELAWVSDDMFLQERFPDQVVVVLC